MCSILYSMPISVNCIYEFWWFKHEMKEVLSLVLFLTVLGNRLAT